MPGIISVTVATGVTVGPVEVTIATGITVRSVKQGYVEIAVVPGIAVWYTMGRTSVPRGWKTWRRRVL